MTPDLDRLRSLAALAGVFAPGRAGPLLSLLAGAARDGLLAIPSIGACGGRRARLAALAAALDAREASRPASGARTVVRPVDPPMDGRPRDSDDRGRHDP